MKTKKYENRCMILWDDVPSQGVMFHSVGTEAGWWPVVEIVLNKEVYEDMQHLKAFSLVICVYQLMWEELVAWPIPIQAVLLHCVKAAIICLPLLVVHHRRERQEQKL
jgi:hypothetical protein